jgi:flagellar motor switch protein FliN/FliY
MTNPLPTPPGSGAPAGTHTTPVPQPRDAGAPLTVGARGIEMLHGVDMEVTVELGRTRMTVRDLLALAPGAVLELDRAAGSPADLLVNGRLIARGEVVVVDEDFGLRVTEILDDAATA